MAGCVLDRAQRARLLGTWGGGEAEVVAGKDRAQPPAFVLRLILGYRGPDFFASGMHSAGFGVHLLHSQLAPC